MLDPIASLAKTRPLGRVLCAAVLALALPAMADEAGFRIVVHPDNPTTELRAAEVSSLLLKKKVKWDHGVPVEPVDLAAASKLREAFSKEIHGRSVSSIKNYWTGPMRSAGKTPPPELKDDAAVVAYVKSHPGAIGYVSPRARLDGVKEVSLAN